jgi:succinylglutamate desuccinylase
MAEDTVGLVEAATDYERILGRFGGNADGPTMIVMCGIHGNEPSGVKAAQRVAAGLEELADRLRGEWIAVTGNRQALRAKSRFLARDLNRVWTPEKLEQALLEEDSDVPESLEQRELYLLLRELTFDDRRTTIFLDLHTSSADGAPFLTVGDTLRNRRLAVRLPLPMILGLEEQVDGALLEHMNNQGHVTLGVEAGHHDRASSIDHHEAVLWLALSAAGMLDARDVPDRERHRATLAEATRGIPRITEVRYRRPVRPGDGFRMHPGFVNFQAVDKGQVVASDSNGEIRARETGRVLLPLYQGQGDDGFFIGREVRPFWLRLSALLRKVNADRIVTLLPGVRRHPREPGALVVYTRVARIYPLEVFHLLGYRKLRQHGSVLIVSRRVFDSEPPRSG